MGGALEWKVLRAAQWCGAGGGRRGAEAPGRGRRPVCYNAPMVTTSAAGASAGSAPRIAAPLLFLNVVIVAMCGLVYELLAGTLGSYLLGDSVTQFSLVIGLYLSAMGFGAWLSRYLEHRLAERFLDLELAVAIVGGLSVPVLFYVFAEVRNFQFALLSFVFATGTICGLELPLLMRILQGNLSFSDLVSRVLTFDYIGALAASLLFPMVFMPKLGLIRTSLLVGMLNAGVALWGTWILKDLIGRRVAGVRVRAVVVILGLGYLLLRANDITALAEDAMYADDVVFAKNTRHQRIVVTHGRAGFNLFLNGNLQFASADEYRYHEALVHPAMAAYAAPPKNVLVLGGGDGLALREILRYQAVERVTLVDLDPGMTGLSAAFKPLAELNRHSFEDPRVTVVNQDAMTWIETTTTAWDVVIVDFPDPNNFALGKLYTKRFYRLLRSKIAPGAVVAIQATSPLFARYAYWCVVQTVRAAGFAVAPYHVTVPSFGEWGFVLATAGSGDLAPPTQIRPAVASELRFLSDASLAALFSFPADMGPVEVEINQLDNQALVRYYEGEWRRWQ